MTTTKIRQFGALQTRDARIPGRDTVLDDKFRITPNSRILAELAPEVGPGDMGVRYDGTGGIPQQADVEALFNGFVGALGLLSAAEVAQMKALMLKFAGAPSGSTNAVGITTSDAEDAVAAVRRGVEALDQMNERNRAFWATQQEATDRAIYGR
jgi:hypothetical protein